MCECANSLNYLILGNFLLFSVSWFWFNFVAFRPKLYGCSCGHWFADGSHALSANHGFHPCLFKFNPFRIVNIISPSLSNTGLLPRVSVFRPKRSNLNFEQLFADGIRMIGPFLQTGHPSGITSLVPDH